MMDFGKEFVVFIKISIYFMTIESEKIFWKNLYFNISEETENFVLGRLMYKLKNNKNVFISYREFDNKKLNKICLLFGYDNIHSFSMPYKTRWRTYCTISLKGKHLENS